MLVGNSHWFVAKRVSESDPLGERETDLEQQNERGETERRMVSVIVKPMSQAAEA